MRKTTKKELKVVKQFYNEDVRDTVVEFVQSKGLNVGGSGQETDYFEWHQNEASIMFGKNIGEGSYRGIRRQVSLDIYLDCCGVPHITVFATAYKDSNKQLKMKSLVFELSCVYREEIFKFLLRNALEVAWRIANAIKQNELVPQKTWLKANNIPS
ncbi:MAG: hypothetical protein A3B75_03050 [Candidatus Terrybacteria bacterium RIFCSPHIGHO2_02_FULL_43_14]|nr:MAG: hypothetical protein A3B75_03050 [Candidatus Terrybacteria bacterium RIFCSPHIGHO2_02_FULL_43_14]